MKKILIVDDEITILKLLNFVLSKSYDVTLKSHGYEAVQWLENGNRPDIIILDMMMPYFNGGDFFNSLKVSGLFSKIPVIVLTGEANVEKVQSQLNFPVELIMTKPFNPEKLKNAIRTILGTTEERMETGITP